MKRYSNRIPTWFAPEVRLKLKPANTRSSQVRHENELQSLKQRMLRELLDETGPRLNGTLRRAANEAAALAWVSPHPLLVFPALFEEMTETALKRAERQAGVRERSRELLSLSE